MQVLKTETLNSIFDRTEIRIKELHSFRQSLIHINSNEDFSSLKLKFTQFFFDIEDDLRESFQSHKSAYLEIKELKDNLKVIVNRYEALESKSKNFEQYNKELKSNMKDYLEQMKLKEEKINEFERKIKNLESEIRALKALNFAERENKNALNNSLNINLTEGNLPNSKTKPKIFHENIKNYNSDIYNNNINTQNHNQYQDQNLINNNNNNYRLYQITQFTDVSNNNNNNFLNENKRNLTENNINSTSNNDNNLRKSNLENFENMINNNKKNNESHIDDNNCNNNKNNDSSIIKIKQKLNNYQVGEILSERENSKKFINDYIKNKLNFNYNYTDDDFSNYNKIHNNINLNNEGENNNKFDKKNLFIYENNFENENFREIKSDISSMNNSGNKFFNMLNMQNHDKNIPKNINVSNLYANNFDDFKNSEKKIDEKENNHGMKIKETQEKINGNNINHYENNNNNKNNNNTNENNTNKNENENEKNPPKFTESKKTNKKADRILDIVVKIRTVEDISAIIFHLFGDDVLDLILSANADEELIDKVEATIKEIERLINKGNLLN
jgi:hypothetical protein